MSHLNERLKGVLFFVLEYLDDLKIAADVAIDETSALIVTDKKNFSVTKDTNAYLLKAQIDEVYK